MQRFVDDQGDEIDVTGHTESPKCVQLEARWVSIKGDDLPVILNFTPDRATELAIAILKAAGDVRGSQL